MCMIVALGVALLMTPAISLANHFLELETKTVCDECLVPVLLQTDAKTIHFISEPQTDSCLINIMNIHSGAAWTNCNRAEEVVRATEWEDLCLIRARDTSGLLILLENCQRAKVILQYSEPDEANITTLFEECWKLGVIDVVVVEDRGNFCFVYSYFPFGKNSCFNTSTVLMSSWDKRQSDSFNYTQTFYPDKLSNLYSCPLQVEYGKETQEASFKMRWSGFVPFLLKAMKATPKMIEMIDRSYPKVIDNNTDLLFDIFYQYNQRIPKFVFSPISYNSISGICFPIQKHQVVEWFRIIDEFSLSVWCGIMTCATLTFFYMYFIFFQRKVDVVLVFLGTIQTLTNSPVPHLRVRRWLDRVCFPLWLYFCLVLSSAYQSTIQSKLTVPFVDDPISTIEDFKRLNIPIHVTYEEYKFATGAMLSEPRHKPITEKMVVFQNLSHNDVLRSNNGRAAYICEDDDVDFYFNGSYQLLPDMLFQTTDSICVLPRPSPYERLFKTAFLRIFDAGAIDLVQENFFQSQISRRRIIDDRIPLSLRTLSGAFLVWVLGSSAALVSFLAEIFVLRMSIDIRNIDIWSLLSEALH